MYLPPDSHAPLLPQTPISANMTACTLCAGVGYPLAPPGVGMFPQFVRDPPTPPSGETGSPLEGYAAEPKMNVGRAIMMTPSRETTVASEM